MYYMLYKIISEFLDELPSNITRSLEGMDRLCRGHGHTLREIALLRTGELFRIPDLVVWPGRQKKRNYLILSR